MMTINNDNTIFCVLHDARTQWQDLMYIYNTQSHRNADFSSCGFLTLMGFEYMRTFVFMLRLHRCDWMFMY